MEFPTIKSPPDNAKRLRVFLFLSAMELKVRNDQKPGKSYFSARRLFFSLASPERIVFIIREGESDTASIIGSNRCLGPIELGESSMERTFSFVFHSPATGIFLSAVERENRRCDVTSIKAPTDRSSDLTTPLDQIVVTVIDAKSLIFSSTRQRRKFFSFSRGKRQSTMQYCFHQRRSRL